jgi:hypothetical protein
MTLRHSSAAAIRHRSSGDTREVGRVHGVSGRVDSGVCPDMPAVRAVRTASALECTGASVTSSAQPLPVAVRTTPRRAREAGCDVQPRNLLWSATSSAFANASGVPVELSTNARTADRR